jgi:hypothetical protein
MVVIALSALLGVAVTMFALSVAAKKHALRWNTARERLRASAIVHEFVRARHRHIWALPIPIEKAKDLTDSLWALASSMQDDKHPKVDEWVDSVVEWTEAGGRI